jgi:hypothetical protein
VWTPNGSQNRLAQSRLAFIGVVNFHLSRGVPSAFKAALLDFLTARARNLPLLPSPKWNAEVPGVFSREPLPAPCPL